MAIRTNKYGERVGAGGPLEPLGWFILEALSRGKRDAGSSMGSRMPLQPAPEKEVRVPRSY